MVLSVGEMVRRTYVREADFPEAEDCNLEKRCSHKLNWLNFIAFRRQDPRRARGPSNSVRFAPRAEQILKSNRECKVVRYSCSLEDPCFENSDCFDGRCCEIYTNRSCPDGSVPLSFPEKCVTHLSNCPLGTFCFEEKCCSFMVIENRSDFESISNKESNNESTFLKVSHQNAMSTKISDKSDNRILQANQVEYYSGLPDTVFQPKMKGKEAT